jgi:ABC-type amino acid transport substrate-binding protein
VHAMRAPIVIAILLCTTASRADEPPHAPITVAAYNEPPFTIRQPDGSFTGIAIELMRMVAAELGTTATVRYVPVEDLTSGKLPDDVVAAVNVTEKINQRFELTHAFYSTGLSIAIAETTKESFVSVLARVFSGTFLWVLIGTVILLGTVGLLMYWVERRPVPQKTTEQQAMSKALFWAFEPVIGYKASQHQTRGGRVLGTVWGLCGVVLVSGLTATLASQLTAQKLAPSVRGPDDLPHSRVGIVEHTAGVRYADRRGLRHRRFPNLDAALSALDRGDVDAVLDDAPNLLYFATTTHPKIRVLPGTFLNHGIAFGLQHGSPLRPDINRAMLKVTSSDAWRSLLVTYLGSAE